MLTKEELPACPAATTVALIGSKWNYYPYRIPRSPAKGRICPQRIRRIHASYHESDGNLGE